MPCIRRVENVCPQLQVEWAADYQKINRLTYDKTYKKFNVQYLLVQSSMKMDDRVIRNTF